MPCAAGSLTKLLCQGVHSTRETEKETWRAMQVLRLLRTALGPFSSEEFYIPQDVTNFNAQAGAVSNSRRMAAGGHRRGTKSDSNMIAEGEEVSVCRRNGGGEEFTSSSSGLMMTMMTTMMLAHFLLSVL